MGRSSDRIKNKPKHSYREKDKTYRQKYDKDIINKSILRRKVWSSGQDLLLADAVTWSTESGPSRNLWTKIRRDPRYVSQLGQYNGNEMRVRYNFLVDCHGALHNNFFNHYLCPRAIPYQLLNDGNNPYYIPNPSPPTTTVIPTIDKESKLPMNYTRRVTFPSNSFSTPALLCHNTPLQELPLALSAPLLIAPFGPDYGCCDSDDESDITEYNNRIQSSIQLAIRERVESVGYNASLSREVSKIAQEQRELMRNSPATNAVLSMQPMLAYEADAAARVHISRTIAEPLVILNEENVPITPAPPTEAYPYATTIYHPLSAGHLMYEHNEIQMNCIKYYQFRQVDIPFSNKDSYSTDLERANGAPCFMVEEFMKVKSLKTYLQNRLGMPLWLTFATIKAMLDITEKHGEKRRSQAAAENRALLNQVTYAHFAHNRFAQDYFDLNIRGGGKHFRLIPTHMDSDELRTAASRIENITEQA